jgi:GH15 family glucan-1,4-alpha-glucosidase
MTAQVRDTPTDFPELAALAASSVALIEALQDPSGAYPASPTFSAYRGYSWFRDGAFIADAMSAAGRVESASAFFDWCAAVLESQQERVNVIVDAAERGEPVPDAEMLPTRFSLDGTIGNDDWWDFQLDGYGTWLWAVVEHSRRHGLDLQRWQTAILLTIDYLLASWRRPCFDWWEEHSEHIHVSTLGCIAAGMRSVVTIDVIDPARLAACSAAEAEILDLIRSQGTVDGHFSKWLGSDAVDGSLLSLISPLMILPASDPMVVATVGAVEVDLTEENGVHRYLGDTFYGGGQWPILTCFLGLAEASLGNREPALARLRWAASTINDADELPEQVGGHLLDPTRVAEWVSRWGAVAQPLLWSHAMYIRLAIELGVVGVEMKEGAK